MHVASFLVSPAPELGMILVKAVGADGQGVLLTMTPVQGLELGLWVKDAACEIVEKTGGVFAQADDETRTHFVS